MDVQAAADFKSTKQIAVSATDGDQVGSKELTVSVKDNYSDSTETATVTVNVVCREPTLASSIEMLAAGVVTPYYIH